MPPASEPVVAKTGTKPSSGSTGSETTAASTGDEKIELPLEMMRALDVQGDFRITSLTALEYQIKQFLLTTKAQKGIIDIKPLSMQVLQGQVVSDIRLNTKKDIPAYAIKLDVNQVQLAPVVNPFLDGVMGDKPLTMEGAMDFDMDVKTSGDTVNRLKKASKGKIILNMKQTQVKGFDPEFYMRSSVAKYIDSAGFGMSETIMGNYKPREVTVFDVIHSTVKLADGKARTKDFLMDSKRVKIKADGFVDIMKDSLDMNTSIELARGKTVLEKVLDEPLFVRVYGPFDALDYKIDTNKLKKSTTDVLKNEAKAKLDAEKKRLQKKVKAEEQRLRDKAKAEEDRLRAKVKAEQKRAEEKAKNKLKEKFKGLF
jgi:AsmA protein